MSGKVTPSRHRRSQKATPMPRVTPRSPQKLSGPNASARSSTRERQGGGTEACGSGRFDAAAVEMKTSARSVDAEAPLPSSKINRGLDSARARSARSIASSTAGSTSARSSVHSTTTCTPRETARTTSTMAMSTARAEATLVVLEAERAQLERRLEKVEEELELEEALTKKDCRKRGIRAPYGPRR